MQTVTIYTKQYCPYSIAAKELLKQKGIPFTEFEITKEAGKRQEMISKSGGRSTVPQVFIGRTPHRGCDDLQALDSRGSWTACSRPEPVSSASGMP
jgi:glutaredoxin 3